MNEQRKVIYKLRREILEDLSNREFVNEMIEDVALFLEQQYTPERNVPLNEWPWEDMKTGFKNTFHTDYEISLDECIEKI
jgi:preprotein translocase subunit SecA